MKFVNLLLIVSIFSCSSNEDKTFNLSANLIYDLNTLKENTIKADPTYVSSEEGLSQLIFDCIKEDKLELSKDGRQGTYSQLKDIIALNYTVSRDTITEQFTQNIQTVMNDISHKWESLKTKQNFVIDLESNSVSTQLYDYNFLAPDKDTSIPVDFAIKQADVISLGSTITEILNDPKYIWIAKISTPIEISAIDFHGKKKKFLEALNEQLTSKKIKIYSKTRNRFHELDIEEYLMNRRDTVITFDPKTYDENIDVRTYSPFHTNDLLKVDLTQLVCFNNIDSSIETFPIDITLFHKPEDRIESIFIIK